MEINSKTNITLNLKSSEMRDNINKGEKKTMDKIKLFKDRKIKAKEVFSIKEISKKKGYDFIKKYHYLKDAKYFSMYDYGLFIENNLVGVATFSTPQGNVALKGWFGITDNSTKNILELSRLCILPSLNGSNATSYLLSNSMKLLKKDYKIRAIITLADSSRHVGSIYQVCNFTYYGLTDKKSDFYRAYDGKKNPRGSTKDIHGVWIPRTRKHRYAYIMDNTLKCKYKKQERPKENIRLTTVCCNNTNIVHDKRFNEDYTCPICTNTLKLI